MYVGIFRGVLNIQAIIRDHNKDSRAYVYLKERNGKGISVITAPGWYELHQLEFNRLDGKEVIIKTKSHGEKTFITDVEEIQICENA